MQHKITSIQRSSQKKRKDRPVAKGNQRQNEAQTSAHTPHKASPPHQHTHTLTYRSHILNKSVTLISFKVFSLSFPCSVCFCVCVCVCVCVKSAARGDWRYCVS